MTDQRKERILLVDSDLSMVRLIRVALLQLGFMNVTVAHDGSAALDAMQGASFDLVMCGIDMQPMNGLDFVRAVRQDAWQGAQANVPIIMLTGDASGEAVRGAHQAGATDYILKPFTVDTMREKIDKILPTA